MQAKQITYGILGKRMSGTLPKPSRWGGPDRSSFLDVVRYIDMSDCALYSFNNVAYHVRRLKSTWVGVQVKAARSMFKNSLARCASPIAYYII